jgi:hypothetical protein
MRKPPPLPASADWGGGSCPGQRRCEAIQLPRKPFLAVGNPASHLQEQRGPQSRRGETVERIPANVAMPPCEKIARVHRECAGGAPVGDAHSREE